MSSFRTPEERTALRAAVAVGSATAVYGVSFGALATLSGLDIWQTCFLSLVMFTGGSQFALIGVLASGGLAAGGAAVTSAALLGTRNVFYSIRMAPVIGPGFFRRAAAAQLTIDESVAVSTAQTTPSAQRLGFWVTGILIYAGWNVTTLIGALIGALIGDLIGDVSAYGLDAAAAAAFLGLLWPRLKARQTQAVAVAAALLATLLTPVLVPGLPVIVAALVAIVVGGFNLFARKQAGTA